MEQPRSGDVRRRTVIGGAAAAAGIGAAGALAPGVADALDRPRRRGSIDDVEHVVVFMQENRSFDHYYGTMAGVRGFGDRTPLLLPGGKDAFHQPDLLRGDGGYLLPFHVDTTRVDGQDLGDLPHDWETTHLAWAGGAYDAWIPAKSQMTMSCFTTGDIPFHRALASAFTLCDNYFCSIQGPTTPNRLYHWTGTIDPDGCGGGPVISNPDDYKPVYRWTTYPERLQAAGISWQVYANDEVGDGSGDDGYVGDYGDNPLWHFHAYHDALASTDPAKRQLAERASLRARWKVNSGLGKDVDHVLEQFIADCRAGTLPAVSWVVAPYAYCEHPAARPVDGAAYTQRMLRALWDAPELWESTVVLINYDENDGFFDHVVPPTAPPGTPGELLSPTGGLPGGGTPIGLGPRVPMTVVSPWSRGGWVNSQVFDHTSVLRFLEVWTGVREPNISAWRRAICGDLTGCFDFREHDISIPALPDANVLRKQADDTQSKLPKPSPPAPGAQVVPAQEPGTAKARPLPYQPSANATIGTGSVSLKYSNEGSAALQLASYAYHLAGAPQRYDVPPQGTASASVPFTGAYDIAVHGPNGFLFEAAGNVQTAGVETELDVVTEPVRLTIENSRGSSVTVGVSGRPALTLGAQSSRTILLAPDHGWYDVTVTVDGQSAYRRRYVGHAENGLPSRTQ